MTLKVTQKCVEVVLLVLLVLPFVAQPAFAVDGHKLVSVLGVKEVAGYLARVDLLLDIPPGADAGELARQALAQESARALSNLDAADAEFVLSGLRWPQFFDATKVNDFVLQHYNPTGETVLGGALTALVPAEDTWTDVPTATFAFLFAGDTSAVSGFDGVNTVGWPGSWVHSSFALAITLTIYELTSGFILDADVELNRNFSFVTDFAGAPYPSWDVQTVMLHENGHVAGLDHSSDPEAVMFPFLAPGETKQTLAQDDIFAISTLYPLGFRPLPPQPPIPPHPPHPSTATPFTIVARLSDSAPGGGVYDFDFEPYALNNLGYAAYAADFSDFFTDSFGEGAFLMSPTGTVAMARSGDPAPGGGTFGFGVWVNIGLNDEGDAAFAFALAPFQRPNGLNSGVYYYSSRTGTLAPVVVPGVTPAPTGGVFEGAFTHADLNNRGQIAFAGIVDTTEGISPPYGMGVFVAEPDGVIRSVAVPGDPAVGGGTFDFADVPSINNEGDIVFGAHVRGEECITNRPQSRLIHCDESLYLRHANGDLISIAHQGDAAPGGGTFRSAFDPVINDRGDVLFLGDLTPAPFRILNVGLFLYTGGTIVPVALPGQEMPGGGHFLTSALQYGNWDLNAVGDVSFSALLDTVSFGDYDTGLFVWSRDTLRLVARTGMEFPGLGTLLKLMPPDFFGIPFSGAALNERGQVLFQGTFLGPTSVVGALVKSL